MSEGSTRKQSASTFGIDIGDKSSLYCGVDVEGRVVAEGSVESTRKGFAKRFEGITRCRFVLEAGTHSRWMSELLTSFGHEVTVADARRLSWIFRDVRKNDRRDARKLALLGLSPSTLKLISPIHHRDERCQADLAVIKARALLVRSRSKLINQVRGIVKGFGERLPSTSAESFAKKTAMLIPEILQPALSPIMDSISGLTQTIAHYDRMIEDLSTKRYPETALLRAIAGVGPLTALCFMLTLEDPKRFRTSRSAGVFVGLTPRQDQSGDTDKQLRITKAGNSELRVLLVTAAHYILGWRGPECQLRRYGERICARGGPVAKKKAVVAVARKLAVLMHHLWKTGEVYDPEHTVVPRRRSNQKKRAS